MLSFTHRNEIEVMDNSGYPLLSRAGVIKRSYRWGWIFQPAQNWDYTVEELEAIVSKLKEVKQTHE